MIYLQLFLSFVRVGLCTFGGGLAAIPLIQQQVVDNYGWMSIDEYSDIITVAQITPGPIAINASTFIGNQVAGIPGAMVAVLGIIFPACIIVTLLAYIYNRLHNMSAMQSVLKFLRPAVIAILFATAVEILMPVVFMNGDVELTAYNVKNRMIVLFVVGIILLHKKKISPIMYILMCGVIEVAYQVLI